MTVSVMGISMWWGILIGIGYAWSSVLHHGRPHAAPARRLSGDRHDRRGRDRPPVRAFGVGQARRSVAPTGCSDFAGAFQQVGADLGIEPAKVYGCWAFKFSGRDLWVLIVGWSLVAIFGVFVWLLMRARGGAC